MSARNHTVPLKRILYRRISTLLFSVIRFIIIFGLAFIILLPIFKKAMMAFMSWDDLLNPAVSIIPTHLSLTYWKQAWSQMKIPESLLNTFGLSFLVAVLQVISCTMVGYGLGRFKFRGRGIAFVFVVLMMLVPYSAISTPQYLRFAFFGFGNLTVSLLDSYTPILILAITCTNIKNGLYIFFLREFFRTMPGNLEEAAYIDGCGPIRTFIQVIVPNARGMMATVFLFSFCWQWTDYTYAGTYFSEMKLLGNIFREITADTVMETTIVRNAASLICMVPLIFIFLILQRTLVRSITLSGLAN